MIRVDPKPAGSGLGEKPVNLDPDLRGLDLRQGGVFGPQRPSDLSFADDRA
jgi:hypothetical protein